MTSFYFTGGITQIWAGYQFFYLILHLSVSPLSWLVSNSFYIERNWIKLQNGFVDLIQRHFVYWCVIFCFSLS